MSEEVNPYQPPRADGFAAPVDSQQPLMPVSVGVRLVNVVIDVIVRFTLAMLLGFGIGTANLQLEGAGRFLFGIVTVLGYYVVFEYFLGFTIGKLITGTRVVDAVTGHRPRFGQILGRSLARLVPFEPFSFLGSAPTGWHDRWSNTIVVRKRG